MPQKRGPQLTLILAAATAHSLAPLQPLVVPSCCPAPSRLQGSATPAD